MNKWDPARASCDAPDDWTSASEGGGSGGGALTGGVHRSQLLTHSMDVSSIYVGTGPHSNKKGCSVYIDYNYRRPTSDEAGNEVCLPNLLHFVFLFFLFFCFFVFLFFCFLFFVFVVVVVVVKMNAEDPNVQVVQWLPQCSNGQMHRYILQCSKCSNARTLECSNAQMQERPDAQMHKH